MIEIGDARGQIAGADELGKAYRAGVSHGLQEGERRGWEMAKEAAAELMQKQTAYPESGDEWEHAADAIRNLKKP